MKLWFQKPLQIVSLRNAENFYLVTIFDVTIFGAIIFDVTIFGGTIFEITKEIPLKFKLEFLCVLYRLGAIKDKIKKREGFELPTRD